MYVFTWKRNFFYHKFIPYFQIFAVNATCNCACFVYFMYIYISIYLSQGKKIKLQVIFTYFLYISKREKDTPISELWIVYVLSTWCLQGFFSYKYVKYVNYCKFHVKMQKNSHYIIK